MTSTKSILRQISDDISRRESVIQAEKRGKQASLSREDLEQGVAEYLASGKEIEQVASYTPGPMRPKAYATGRNGRVN